MKIITSKYLLISFLALLISTSVLLSCNSGGSSDNHLNSGGYYLPYLGSLHVVDSATFTKHTISHNDLPSATILQSFEYDSVTKTSYDFQDKYAVYIDDNKLWKLNLTSISDLAPGPVIYGDISNNCIRENYGYLESYPLSISNPEKSMILYETNGSDGDCSTIADNRQVMVRVDHPANSSPIDVTDKVNFGKIYVLFENTNSEASQILVNDYSSNTIIRYDSNFDNPTILMSGTTSTRIIDNTSFAVGGVFLLADDNLYWYNADTRSLSDILFTHSNAWNIFTHCDKEYCYFSIRENSSAYSIYRVASDGKNPAEPFALSVSTSTAYLVGPITNNHIFTYAYQYDPVTFELQSIELYKIPKTGGEPILIDSSNMGIHLAYANDSNTYYDKLMEETTNEGTQITTATAIILDENDSIALHFPNAMWAGAQHILRSKQFTASKLVLLKNILEM
ncbi:hypothetical protein [Kaarinaea lacus]